LTRGKEAGRVDEVLEVKPMRRREVGVRVASRMAAIMAICALGGVLAGCPSAGIYRTARTLEEGNSDFGMAFSATRIAAGETTTTDPITGEKTTEDATSVVIPNLIPELNYHIGLTDDFEFGGRIAVGSLLMELDGKYRLMRSEDGRFHLAVQPAVGYRTAVVIEGINATLPVIVTYELARRTDLNVYGYGSYVSWTSTDDDMDVDLTADGLMLGGGMGLQFTGRTFYIMPMVDVSRLAWDSSGGDGDASSDLTLVTFGVAFGWYGGRELKKLEKMDEKLDRIENKLDKLEE